MTFLSCGTTKRGESRLRPLTVEDLLWAQAMSYPEESVPLFLYTEGLLNRSIGGEPEFSKYLFREAVARDSAHAPSYYELAGLYSDQPDSALMFARKAFELDTANVWYHSLLGELYIYTGRYDSALTIYTSLIRDDPDNAENYRLMAALYQARKNPFAAIAILDSAEKVLGRDPEITAFKRDLYTEVSLFSQAISETEDLLELYPLDVSNYVALAELYSYTRKDSMAMSYYEKALEISPDNIPTIISMNSYYRNNNNLPGLFSTTKKLFLSDDIRVENKISFFKDLTRSRLFYQNNFPQINDLILTLATKHPDNYDVMDLYAGHLIASGKLDDALAIYKAYLSGTSRPRAEAYNNIIDMEAYLGRADSLNKYADLAVEAFPDDVDVRIRKASGMAYLMKDYKGAEKEYREALEYAEGDSLKSVIYAAMGDNRYSMKDYKKCYAYYDTALKYDSLNVVLLNNYSYYLSERDMRLDDAEKMAVRANELSGGSNPTYIDTYAWVLYKQGRTAEALAQVRRAVSLDTTESAELNFHYAEILYRNGDEFLAKTYWQKALEYGYDPETIEQRLNLVK